MSRSGPSPDLDRDFAEADLRAALGTFATGIAVLTCRDGDGAPVGLTVNSFNSVSLDPPLVLWSLARRSPLRGAFEGCSHFAVNVLAADQVALSQRFAAASADKFAGLALAQGTGGAPLLAGCCAWFECRNAQRHDGGDHIIFIGHVAGVARAPREPLIYHAGRYRELAAGGPAAGASDGKIPT